VVSKKTFCATAGSNLSVSRQLLSLKLKKHKNEGHKGKSKPCVMYQ
jgi:hypothetical protein